MQIKAWTWNGGTEPTGLRLVERELRSPADDEVLVENKAVALNPVDWKLIKSAPKSWRPDHIPGVDGAGVVVASGAKAGVAVGARVAYHHDLNFDGSYATHTLVPAKALLTVPAELDFAKAATVPCPGMTAWQAVHKMPAAPGRDVLVVGGGAATGFYMVQLASQLGYTVWTTASPEHATALKAAGAAGSFDYRDEDWREALKQALDGRQLYAAIDNRSEAHARTLAPLLGYEGHLVCLCGRLNSPETPAFSTVISLHEIALGAAYQHGSLDHWAALRTTGGKILNDLATGTMQPPAIAPFAFEQLGETLAAMKTGSLKGKPVTEL